MVFVGFYQTLFVIRDSIKYPWLRDVNGVESEMDRRADE
jgi:hypothetical protein